ncbi:MAG: WD40 repeat domain-containing protein [Anaerolineales bacterium]
MATATLPAPEVVDTEAVPTAEPTPLDKPALLASLEDGSVLSADNLADLQFLGQFNLTEEPTAFTFRAWSPDGSRLALCYPGETSRVVIYDLEGGDQITTIEIPADVCPDTNMRIVDSFTLSRNGDLLLAPMEQGFGIYQTATGELLSQLDFEFPGFLEQAAFSSQGTRLAVDLHHPVAPEGRSTGLPYSAINLFEVETGSSFGLFFQRDDWYITDLEYSTEGEYLVVASSDGVEAWHVEGGQLPIVDCPDAEITFSPVRDEAALSCHPMGEDIVWEQMVWDLATGDLTPLSGTSDTQILDLRYSPDGALLAGLSESGSVSIWDAATGEHLLTLDEPFESPVDLAFVHGGRALAVLNEFGFVGFYTAP